MSPSVRIFATAGALLAWSVGMAGEAEARSFRLYDMSAALAEPYPLDVRPKHGASRMPSDPPPARRTVAPVRPAPTMSAPAPALPARTPVPAPAPMATVAPKPAPATAPAPAAPTRAAPARTAPDVSASAMPAPGTAIPPAGSSAAGEASSVPAPPAAAPSAAAPAQPTAAAKPAPRRPVTTAQRRARPARTSRTGGGGRRDGWYLTGAVGGGVPMDADNSGSTLDIESSYDFGFLVSGGGGYSWRNGFRAEAEILYATYSLDQVAVTRATGLGVAAGSRDAEGDLSALALMANGAYDFDLGISWHPYVLAGAGIARVSLSEVAAAGAIVDDEAFAVAFQAGLGIDYALTNQWSLGLGYRFFSTLSPEFDDAAGNSFESEVFTHNVLLGTRYRF